MLDSSYEQEIIAARSLNTCVGSHAVGYMMYNQFFACLFCLPYIDQDSVVSAGPVCVAYSDSFSCYSTLWRQLNYVIH